VTLLGPRATPLDPTREHHDWVSAFLGFTSHGEAPTKMYFWVGVATIAAALRRRVWFDQRTFRWYPNLYTLLVAPPGVVSKTTTAKLGFDQLLRKVPGIKFGPDVVTWQALLDAFQTVHEMVHYRGEQFYESALTVAVGEFGNFLRPDDRDMVDQLVNLWDGESIKKQTRMDGEQYIDSPCLNMIGCTTPSWIAQNFPEYLIGGGLTSRMLFVYADTKAKFVAYPFRHVPPNFDELRESLIRDLERISQLVGPFSITDDAVAFGEEWYERWHAQEAKRMDENLLGGYISRKQTLAHKVAMCLSASQGNSLIIDRPTLERAVNVLSELEADMPKVYSKIGMSQESGASLTVLSYVQRAAPRPVPYQELYRYLFMKFPNPDEFNKLIEGMTKSGMLGHANTEQGLVFTLPGVGA
jgi:Protein of unknown function (DUF3987)